MINRIKTGIGHFSRKKSTTPEIINRLLVVYQCQAGNSYAYQILRSEKPFHKKGRYYLVEAIELSSKVISYPLKETTVHIDAELNFQVTTEDENGKKTELWHVVVAELDHIMDLEYLVTFKKKDFDRGLIFVPAEEDAIGKIFLEKISKK